MSFLGQLAGQISSQFSLGDNTNHSLDAVVDGQNVKYGSLGDFASKFDQSAERRYVEEGYLRRDPYNTDPKQFEILMQEPNATVLIKKRMFSSVGDNFRPDFMDADEKLYYKAMKILFQNKCRQIGVLEKLSKIQKISSAAGNINDQIVPIIISLTDALNNGLDQGSNLFGSFGSNSNPLEKSASDLTLAVEKLRKIYAFNTTNPITTWITDDTNLFQSQFGQGTGVMEITNFTNLSTTISTDISNAGSFSLNIVDPYETMLITEYDIEKAISDATNMFYNRKIFQFGKEGSEKLIKDLSARLNQYRAARNASPISFKINPDTLLGKRVTAILDRIGTEIPFTYDSSSAAALFTGGAFGQGVTVPSEYLRNGTISNLLDPDAPPTFSFIGEDGLDPVRKTFSNIKSDNKHLGPDSELSLFNRLVSTIYSKLSLDANSKNAFQLNNEKTNYTRRKLRFNFSGKLIIQPMDVVHIYMNSKSRFDNKLLSGLNNMFTGLGMLQNLNKTLVDFKQATTLFNPSGNVPLQVEKSAFVGPNFPNWLWSLVRGQFVTENEGTHVFAGVVQGARDSWAGGKFTISVNGTDNTTYFDQGKVNFKPGIDKFNGSILDPLTPFVSNFDTIRSNTSPDVPVLLEENKVLLGTSQDLLGGNTEKGKSGAALVKYKMGRYAGQLVNESNIIQDRSLDPLTNRITRTFYAPDGLVYKWKEGIGVFTQSGSSFEMNDPNRVGSPNVSNDPFAGQDIMNVLSLLIAGVPYNFSTYFKSNLDSFNRDPQSKNDAAHSFATSLRNDLSQSNTLWGNFIPFKNLTMDEATYSKALQRQTTIIEKNQKLNEQISKLRDLNEAAINIGAAKFLKEKNNDQSSDSDFFGVKEKISILRKEIDATISQIRTEEESYGKKNGDDTSFEASSFVDSNTAKKSISDSALRRLLRRKLDFLTRRMSYNVRANEDKNLFIVDDFYDKDFDILAYEQSLADGIKVYNNDFTSVREKIRMTAQLLNLEVFCDTQGHVRVRPPQYNRMPSSVFYRMMYLKQTLGIQIFPKFLDDLFKSKLDTLKIRLEVLEDQIRLDCAILDYNDDVSATAFILGGEAFTKFVHIFADTFSFVSDNDGNVSEFGNLITAANPDQKDDGRSLELNTFEKQALSNKTVFSNSQKYSALIESLKKQELNADGLPVTNSPSFLSSADERLNGIINRIETKSGQKIDKQDFLIKVDTKLGVKAPTGVRVDSFKIVQDLSDKIQERQKVLKLFYNTLKSSKEFNSLDDQNDNTRNQLINQGVFGNSHIPEVFEHMIEDETYDDYGLGSGKRYIIKRSQIRSLSIAENPPSHSAVEVQGVLNTFAPRATIDGLNTFPGGGNGLITAFAIDYDMWRNYGYKEPAVIQVPFLSDPVSQCAPYAAMILSRNRKDILRGNVVISGNEFMQPGEVVFLEDRGLLFYVTSVSHNFNFGSDFTTSLELTYGHTPGEYIPTVMDVIGKMVYNNKDVADLIVQRQDTSGNDINIGIIQKGVDQNNKNTNAVVNTKNTEPVTSFSDFNTKTISNILYTSSYLINANESKGNNVIGKVELRVYYDDKEGSADADIMAFANNIKSILIGDTPVPINRNQTDSSGSLVKTFPKDIVSIVPININSTDDRRSPSQKAFDAARNQVANRGMGSLGASPPTNNSDGGKGVQPSDVRDIVKKDKIRAALFRYVVDCWLKIETVPPQKSNGS